MSKPTSRTPTMTDVAQRAGVSQMTVSRVMRQSGYISDTVRDRVMQAATELGYVNNRLAAGLRTRTSPLVAVVLPTLGNRVFTDILSGVNETLQGHGLRAVFGVTEYDAAQEERLVRDLLSWQPQGILLPGTEHSDGTRAAIEAAGVRVVEVMDIDGPPIAVSVGVSQHAAGAGMARHLLARGYRRIAYLGAQGGRDLRAGKRLAAFADALRAGGGALIAQRVSDSESSMMLGRAMTQALLWDETPDAIYYSNDDLAAGGLMHCLAHGIAVPDTLALAGFNGLAFTEALPLRLTTTRTPRFRIGQEAGRLLAADDPLPDDTPRRIDLGVELIPGQTS